MHLNYYLFNCNVFTWIIYSSDYPKITFIYLRLSTDFEIFICLIFVTSYHLLAPTFRRSLQLKLKVIILYNSALIFKKSNFQY